MKKKLIIDLKSLAQDILQLEEGQEIDKLRKKIQEIYEKLSVLDYLNKNSDSSKDNIIDNQQVEKKVTTTSSVAETMESSFEEQMKKELEINSIKPKIHEVLHTHESIEEGSIDLDDLFTPTFDSIKDDFSQIEEFKDTVSLDDTENLFETKKDENKQLSLNDKLLKSNIQVGLNDRIAFVNNLFNYSQSDFNKTLSILNEFESEIEAKSYIQTTLKVKYNWIGKEEIEERFVLLVERKFL